MGKKNNDKGVITWIFTLITLILSLGFVAAMFGAAFGGGGVAIWALVLAIVGIVAGIYLWWHGIMILLGIAENTWLFVIVAFFASALIGGILMLVAKILN